MKQKLMRTPPQHKILQGESEKLKEKLDSLKKQIQAKKKAKQISKLAQPQQHRLSHSRKSTSLNLQISQQLTSLLGSLKLQNLAAKFKQKRIFTSQQFNGIKTEQLESWKDIAIGYRIKIKKYLQAKEGNGSPSRVSSSLKSSQKIQQGKLNIEEIIKNRKEGQKYIPLKHNNQQIQSFQNELEEQQQEIMIRSLKTAFNFHKNNSPKSNLIDEEQYELEEMRYKQPIQRVKTAMLNQRQWAVQNLPDYKYCWSCLKMVKDQKVSYNFRQFCGQVCLQNYKQTLQIQDQKVFFANVQMTQQKFNQHMYKRYMSQTGNQPTKQQLKRKELPIEDLDLQIL